MWQQNIEGNKIHWNSLILSRFAYFEKFPKISSVKNMPDMQNISRQKNQWMTCICVFLITIISVLLSVESANFNVLPKTNSFIIFNLPCVRSEHHTFPCEIYYSNSVIHPNCEIWKKMITSIQAMRFDDLSLTLSVHLPVQSSSYFVVDPVYHCDQLRIDQILMV